MAAIFYIRGVNMKKQKMSIKVAIIKKQIELGLYDWKKAVEDAADRIIAYPESLIWS